MGPEGCYLLFGQLWLATNPPQHGNGMMGNRIPICATQAYPTTTTTTSVASTTTTSTTWGWPSLYCVVVMRTTCYENDLVKAQIKEGVGVFLCDEYGVYSQNGKHKL